VGIRITKVGDGLYTAKSFSPAGAEEWSTVQPLSRGKLIDELRKRGEHQTDIGDAFYDADPDWLSSRSER